MNADTIVIIAVVAVILILFLFITAKGDKRKLTVVNSEDQRIDLSVEIADNFTTKAKGLMGRSSIGEYEGMLFVFNNSGIYPFWMMNTTIPLDAIYVSEKGDVVDVIEMDPCGLNVTKCRLYTPKAEAMYVLEVNQGFSKKHKIVIDNSKVLINH